MGESKGRGGGRVGEGEGEGWGEDTDRVGKGANLVLNLLSHIQQEVGLARVNQLLVLLRWE